MAEPLSFAEDAIQKLCSQWDWPYIWSFNTNYWRTSSIHMLMNRHDAELLVHAAEAKIHDISDVFLKQLSFSSKLLSAFSSNDEYFVRLSTRSPKDLEIIQQPCCYAHDAIMRIVQSHRTINDLLVYLYYTPSLADVTLELVKFDSKLVDDYVGKAPTDRFEARCFVYKNQLVAISHYYSTQARFVKESEISSLVNTIRASLNDAVTQSSLRMVNGTAVTDFMITVGEEQGQVLSASFIEINPYGERGGTGPLLFNWSKDKKILEGCNKENTIVNNVCVRWVNFGDGEMVEHFVEPNTIQPRNQYCTLL